MIPSILPPSQRLLLSPQQKNVVKNTCRTRTHVVQELRPYTNTRRARPSQQEPVMLPWLSSPSPNFPATSTALDSPNGLLAAGGELSPAWLVDAYRQGVFPWFSDDDPILWWSPDPRMILLPEQFKQRRSLTKRLRHGGFHITLDQHFDQVIHACACLLYTSPSPRD